MEFFRPGLLLLPTHTWRTINAANPVFDVCTSPCCVGILPELFRQRPGVVRSLHPTHSIAGYGQQAVSYLAGEELRNTPCTPGGCYDRLKDVGGKILLVGVTHARNTYIHSIEEVLNVPHRLADQPMKLQSVDTDGSAHTVYMRSHYNAQQPHISEDFVKLTQAYLDCGAAQNTRFGAASCILCDAPACSASPAMCWPQTRSALSPPPASHRSGGRGSTRKAVWFVYSNFQN